MSYAPGRGDFVWVDFSPQAGHEMRDRHAALVLTPEAYSVATGLALVVPLTTKAKGGSFEVPVRGARKAKGVVLANELRTIDYAARAARKFDDCPREVLERVQAIAEAVVRGE
ncbi:MAG: mRNA-degrading endonuclease [Alphaproteobacteria bacterium]|nr:mRNA-degrading endonuclease [Alphaproteobacteria bacterium]